MNYVTSVCKMKGKKRIAAISLFPSQKQICNIEREQQRIKDEIMSLQEKLSVLHSHQEEFQSQCNALEEVKENEFRQLKSIRDTKKGIEKQRDKVVNIFVLYSFCFVLIIHGRP